MAYSDFTLDRAVRSFSLRLVQDDDLFAGVPELAVDAGLRATLDNNTPLGMAINTEKARSELIVVPILLEIRRLNGQELGFFSGITFDVEPEKGLSGVCNFLLSRSPNQWILGPPVLTIVEAKNDNIKSGLGQCVAEMVAARIFNEREGAGPSTISGAVTTGSNWRFLRLEGETVSIDRREYYLDHLGEILAILDRCVAPAGRN